MRKTPGHELQELAQEMISMRDDVGGCLLETVETLRALNLERAQQVAQSGEQIDIQGHQTEKMCLNLITLQQPIAGDLHMIAACLKILTDMERVTSQCTNICEIVADSNFNGNSLALSYVVRMLGETYDMFRRPVDMSISHDVEEAKTICQYDNVVGSVFSKIILEVCNTVMQNPRNMMCEVDMTFITKYVERATDHATSIAEWVICVKNGVCPELNEKM